MRMTLVVVALLGAAPAGEPAQPSPTEQLAWFAGCWQTTRDGQVIDEQWMAPGGGVMLGMSRTVRAGRATSTEFVRLHEVGGRAVYEANPAQQGPTPFTATFVSAERAVFENAAHDYPKRIVYERRGESALVASIDDGAGGKRVEYPFRRVMCVQP